MIHPALTETAGTSIRGLRRRISMRPPVVPMKTGTGWTATVTGSLVRAYGEHHDDLRALGWPITMGTVNFGVATGYLN